MDQVHTLGGLNSPELIEPLLAAMAEGVMLLDGTGRLIDCNPAAERILGGAREQILGGTLSDPHWEVVREDGSRVGPGELPGTRAAGAPAGNLVIGVRRACGERVWLSIRWHRVASLPEVGAVTLLTFSDLTDLRRARLALERSERRFRQFAEAAPIPIWLAGPDARREYFNQRWLDHVGHEAFAASGRDWTAFVHPADLPEVEAAQQSLRHSAGPLTYEYRLRDRRGRYRWFTEQVSRRLDDDGDLAGYTGIAIDIDLCRRSLGRVRTLSRAVEQSAARIVITDEQGAIEYINPACCAAYGYPPEELIGQNPRIFKSGQTPPQTYENLWRTLAAGQTWRGELTNRSRDGQLLIETVTISPVRDEHGVTRHFVAVKEDITALRNATLAQRDLDARLGRLERMRTLNTLAGGVAHEFNNILVAILGFSDLGARMLAGGGDPEKVVRYLEEIRNAGERARALVAQLRAFGRTGDLRLAPVDAAGIVDDTLVLLAATLPASQHAVSQIEAELPRVEADRLALQQVLMNLGLNARDAMPEGGTIRFAVTREMLDEPVHCDSCHASFAGEFVCIEVADQGPGIADEIKANVFEPFFTTKELGLGSGMGLAVVHGTMHQFGGHVVVGRPPAGGASVRVYLPLAHPGG